jgi:hypothetical protein
VSAHYIESHETGTDQKIEPIKVHKSAPVEEVKVKYAECIPLKWIRFPQKCFKVNDIEKQKPKIIHE